MRFPHAVQTRRTAVALAALVCAGAGAPAAGAMGHGSMAGMDHAAMTVMDSAAMTAMADAAIAQADRSAVPTGSGFEAGSELNPLFARGPKGPLWVDRSSAPAGSMSSTMSMGVAGEPVATRAAVLTTTQATKQLSRRCRSLLRARKSKLSRHDRAVRSSCIRKRRAIVKASIGGTPVAPSTGSGSSGPTAPAPGTTPTPAPGAATPTPTPSAAPTPTPSASSCPPVAAIGVKAIDDGQHLYFQVTRVTACATTGKFSFELDNTDSQTHNLFIQNKVDPGTPRAIVDDLAMKSRKVGADIALAPGVYQLRCLISGHESMNVTFTVTAA